ncbi:MAG: MBL fold metallo-hydrolase [Myxococcota bacterium]
MARKRPLLRFWGVRGSIPTPGLATSRYGGNTACVELRVGDERIVFDAGTGLRELGNSLNGMRNVRLNLLLGHYHWDHLLGLPFFTPLFKPDTVLDIYGEHKGSGGPEEAIRSQFRAPHFPVDFRVLPSRLRFHHVQRGDSFKLGPVTIHVGRLNHPQGAVGYRAEVGRKSVVYASDHEHAGDGDPGLIEFAHKADVLIYDAMFTNASYAAGKQGWGHSTWEEAVRVAKAAKVKQLFIFHHDPVHDDKRMAAIERALKKAFPGGAAAREGLEVEL